MPALEAAMRHSLGAYWRRASERAGASGRVSTVNAPVERSRRARPKE